VTIEASIKPDQAPLSAVAERSKALSPQGQSSLRGRVLSVDALRGFDMFWITGGGVVFLKLADAVHSPVTAAIARQLDHVPWVGFHFYDLIHPLFLFVVGLVMPISFRRRLAASSPTVLWKHILKRVAILWILGMIVQGNLLSYRFSKVAFYSNTLQTIAVGYLIASVLILYTSISSQFLIALGMLVVYGAILALVPVPGIGYWFGFNEGWPVGWEYDDDFYVEYIDGVYYLFNLRHPGFRLTLNLF
jgi:predicted acyltransferase